MSKYGLLHLGYKQLSVNYVAIFFPLISKLEKLSNLTLTFAVNVILNHVKNVRPFSQQVHILIIFILHYALLIQILVILAR